VRTARPSDDRFVRTARPSDDRFVRTARPSDDRFVRTARPSDDRFVRTARPSDDERPAKRDHALKTWDPVPPPGARTHANPPVDRLPVAGRCRSRPSGQRLQVATQPSGTLEQPFQQPMGPFPDRNRRDQCSASCRCQPQRAQAFIPLPGLHLNKPEPLQRLQIRRQRRAIHRQQRRNLPNVRRFRPIQRHQQRELATGKADRSKRLIISPRQGTRRALHVQA
jgi:hypothetical protein